MSATRPARAGYLPRHRVRWWRAGTADREACRRLLDAALDAVAGGAPDLKNGRRKSLYRLALRGPMADHLLKVTRYAEGSPWPRRLRGSKARRELALAIGLRDVGIDTPLPIAAAERRSGGLLTACYLLVPLDPDALDLAALARSQPSAALRRRAAQRFGAAVRRLHEIGFRQADFAPNNFLWRESDGAASIVPIDFERAQLRAGQAQERALRVQSLAKLERHCGEARLSERLRFLTAYTGGRAAARDDWRAIEESIAELFALDRRRLQRFSTRRQQRFRTRGWNGWTSRRSPELGPIARSLEASEATPHAAVRRAADQWVGCYRAASGPGAAELWATAQALSVRGLAPRPICAASRAGEIRILLEAKIPASAQSVEATGPSQVALTRAIARLLGLGGLSPDVPAAAFDFGWVDGSLRWLLVDIAQLRADGVARSDRLPTARAISERVFAADRAR